MAGLSRAGNTSFFLGCVLFGLLDLFFLTVVAFGHDVPLDEVAAVAKDDLAGAE